MEYNTKISAPTAHLICKGLEEIGAGTSLECFVDAVKWPYDRNESSRPTVSSNEEYEIKVTPKVTVAVLEVVNGGQLVCFVGSDVTSQDLLTLLDDWQKALSMSNEDPTTDADIENARA